MTYRLFFGFLALAAVLILDSSPARATASTHIWAPSTDVQPYLLWHATSDFYMATKKTEAGERYSTVTNLGVTVGVLPFRNYNLELGVDHKTGTADDYPFYLNAKFGIPENAITPNFPGMAVGVFDAGFKKGVTDYDVFYGKAAKSCSAGRTSLGRFSLGYFSGNDRLLLDSKLEKDNAGLFGAWERTMSEISDNLWVAVEYMGTESAYGTFNFGAAWKFAPNVGVILGYDIYNNADLPPTATVQVDIDFGK